MSTRSDQDERAVYDDRNYFTRGRSGYRPDPTPPVASLKNALIALAGLLIMAATFYLAVRLGP